MQSKSDGNGKGQLGVKDLGRNVLQGMGGLGIDKTYEKCHSVMKRRQCVRDYIEGEK